MEVLVDIEQLSFDLFRCGRRPRLMHFPIPGYKFVQVRTKYPIYRGGTTDLSIKLVVSLGGLYPKMLNSES
jgi:hypothetical protein